MNLSDSVFSQLLSTAVAAGTTTVNSASVTVRPYDALIFNTVIGTITATAVTSVKLQHSDDGSVWVDVTDSSVAVLDSQSDKMVRHIVMNPAKPFMRVVVSRGTANSVVNSISVAAFSARKLPPVSDASVAATVTLTEVV